MKRFIGVLFSAAAISFCLAACGNKSGSVKNVVLDSQFAPLFSVHDCTLKNANWYCLFTNKTNANLDVGPRAYGGLGVYTNVYDSRDVKVYDGWLNGKIDPGSTSEIRVYPSGNNDEVLNKIVLSPEK